MKKEKEMFFIFKGIFIILKGKRWALSAHSYKQWKNEYRNPNDLPIIPYYKWAMSLPYGTYKLHGKTVRAKATYFFPFAFRYFVDAEEETIKESQV